MPRLIKLLIVAFVVVLVGTQVDWRLALAPLLGLSIWAWARATMRSFIEHGQTGTAATTAPEPVGPDENTMYWCEECGTEFLLVTRGSGVVPRHCGVKMHERVEVLGGPAEPGADDAPLAAPTLPRRERG